MVGGNRFAIVLSFRGLGRLLARTQDQGSQTSSVPNCPPKAIPDTRLEIFFRIRPEEGVGLPRLPGAEPLTHLPRGGSMGADEGNDSPASGRNTLSAGKACIHNGGFAMSTVLPGRQTADHSPGSPGTFATNSPTTVALRPPPGTRPYCDSSANGILFVSPGFTSAVSSVSRWYRGGSRSSGWCSLAVVIVTVCLPGTAPLMSRR